MKYAKVTLEPLTRDDRDSFILDNQWAFKYGAMMEFGMRDDSVDAQGEIISRETIEHCLDKTGNAAYRIWMDGKKVGGVILAIHEDTGHNELEILFVHPDFHSLGVGYGAWQAVEAMYPDTKVWETCTPYFEKRNIHFYINKCGFQAVEFFHAFHRDPNMPEEMREEGPDEMFRFVKIMQKPTQAV